MFRTPWNFIPRRSFLALYESLRGTGGWLLGGGEQMGLIAWTDDFGTGRPSDARAGLWT